MSYFRRPGSKTFPSGPRHNTPLYKSLFEEVFGNALDVKTAVSPAFTYTGVPIKRIFVITNNRYDIPYEY